MKIKILTDSLSDIPKELIKEHDICVLPLKVRFGEEEYKDQETITTDEFFEKLEESDSLPKTAQVIPSEYIEKINKYLGEGYDHIIIINGSSKLSGTHQSALIAREETDPGKVHVIDSLSASYGCGLLVIKAAQMAKEGIEYDKIVETIEGIKSRVHVYFSVETLDYLKKGGRLSATQAVIGNLLNVRPILHIKDGYVQVYDKVRGSKRMLKKMVDLCKNNTKNGKLEEVILIQGKNQKAIDGIKKNIEDEAIALKVLETRVGATIGVYTGPSIVGVIFIN